MRSAGEWNACCMMVRWFFLTRCVGNVIILWAGPNVCLVCVQTYICVCAFACACEDERGRVCGCDLGRRLLFRQNNSHAHICTHVAFCLRFVCMSARRAVYVLNVWIPFQHVLSTHGARYTFNALQAIKRIALITLNIYDVYNQCKAVLCAVAAGRAACVE